MLLLATLLTIRTVDNHQTLNETNDDETKDNRTTKDNQNIRTYPDATDESDLNDAKIQTNMENESSRAPLESLNGEHKAAFISNNVHENRSDDEEENKRTLPDDGFDLSQAMNAKQRELDEAVIYGIKSMQELYDEKEPKLYHMGLILDKNHPASYVAKFGAPNQRALILSRFGYATLEATRKIAETYPDNVGRESGFPEAVQSRLLLDECPLGGVPRCAPASRRYRTADGTCNNLRKPWRGSAMLPMQRFLPPVYEDGIQSIRRSVFDNRLPSARSISTRVHRDKNHEIQTVTLMFMQWGQFIDHDVTSVVKSRSFNGSIPRCCDRGGRSFLPSDLMHPACLPIEAPDDDWFLSQFRIRCIEFLRSAPSTRIDCDLGWREQINQVTPFIDGSTIYGSDIETSDSMRTFRNGKLIYGRPHNEGPLDPPDPPGGELCRSGAITTDCFQSGDGRSSEQPGLTALHTVWVRYHNKIATVLAKLNGHWSDEKVFQETRKIVYSVIQHITYREFLPIVLGQEVMELFELNLVRKGFYTGYDNRVNPQIANSFSTAAYRFGHSMIQNSYVRADSKHRPILNNVTLHEDTDNSENIWSFGSVDRLILGFVNQPSQRRDEFIADELTNHLFQFSDSPFGMDLAAINIQRGRDHGLPPYTAWREPCGLSKVKTWQDLEDIMSFETTQRFRSLYEHVDDVDLFSGGLAEKPLRGGVVGPTFACIIAQQFLNLRKGDRFWYENGNFDNSFTPAQLQQIRHVTLAQVLCQTLEGIETLQPFVFLSHDNFRNVRLPCDSPLINNFDLAAWGERDFKEIDDKLDLDEDVEEARAKAKTKDDCNKKRTKRRKTPTNPNRLGTVRPPSINTSSRPSTTSNLNIRTTTKKKTRKTDPPLKIPITKITTDTVLLETKYGNNNQIRPSNVNTYSQPLQYYNDDRTQVTYLFGVVSQTTPAPSKTDKPLELNIKIQYYLPTTTTTTKKPSKRKRTKTPNYSQTNRPNNDISYPVFVHQDSYNRPSNDQYQQTTSRPTNYYRPNSDYDRPSANFERPSTNYDSQRPIYSYDRPTNNRPSDSYNSQNFDNYNDDSYNRPADTYVRPNRPSYSNNKRTTTQRTYVIRPTSYYENFGYQSQYEQTPFYTTKKTYRPTTQRPAYGDLYEYDYTTKRPSYNRPSNGYHRDDPISEVYSQLFDEGQGGVNIPMKPTFGQFHDDEHTINDKISSNIPNKIYSIAHVQKVDDKLDFKTKLVYNKRGNNFDDNADYDDTDDDRRFVKISSVKSDKIMATSKNKFIHTVQSKEGQLDLDSYDGGKKNNNGVRLVEIDVIPSEVGKEQWVFFNATEELMPLVLVPDINKNISCSMELPKPIRFKKPVTNEKIRRHD